MPENKCQKINTRKKQRCFYGCRTGGAARCGCSLPGMPVPSGCRHLYAGNASHKRSALCSAAVPAFWLLSAEQIISAYQKARDNCACNPHAFQQHHNYHSDCNPKHCKSAYLFHISTSILSNLTPA